MYLSLMGTFSCPAPVLMIGSSFVGASASLNSVSFCTTHMEDPWILPLPSASSMLVDADVSFPATIVAYHMNIDHVLPAWAIDSSHSHEFLDDVFS